MTEPFVPSDFEPPTSLVGDGFHLEPLGPEHNERDHAAWMSSLDHIHATPGFEDSDWPMPMSLIDNLDDLERHARDFRERTGFTYSVLDADEVIGCVYLYVSTMLLTDSPSEPSTPHGHPRRSCVHAGSPGGPATPCRPRVARCPIHPSPAPDAAASTSSHDPVNQVRSPVLSATAASGPVHSQDPNGTASRRNWQLEPRSHTGVSYTTGRQR